MLEEEIQPLPKVISIIDVDRHIKKKGNTYVFANFVTIILEFLNVRGSKRILPLFTFCLGVVKTE